MRGEEPRKETATGEVAAPGPSARETRRDALPTAEVGRVAAHPPPAIRSRRSWSATSDPTAIRPQFARARANRCHRPSERRRSGRGTAREDALPTRGRQAGERDEPA